MTKQREIKFRYRIELENGKVFTTIKTIEEIEDNFKNYLREARILSRDLFIGLKDKNRKEIYEGDINKWLDKFLKKEIKEVIKWDNKFGRFDGFCGNGTDEVIGNIYENPELLKRT